MKMNLIVNILESISQRAVVVSKPSIVFLGTGMIPCMDIFCHRDLPGFTRVTLYFSTVLFSLLRRLVAVTRVCCQVVFSGSTERGTKVEQSFEVSRNPNL